MTSVHEKVSDMVNRPGHYVYGDIECKELEKAISEKMKLEEPTLFFSPYESRLYFASVEYVLRAPFKNGTEDLEKAIRDLQELVQEIKKQL